MNTLLHLCVRQQQIVGSLVDTMYALLLEDLHDKPASIPEHTKIMTEVCTEHYYNIHVITGLSALS
jgi:hypothetical protein